MNSFKNWGIIIKNYSYIFLFKSWVICNGITYLPFNCSDHHKLLLCSVSNEQRSWQWLSATVSTICLLFCLPLVQSHCTGVNYDSERLVPWPSTILSSWNSKNKAVSVTRTIYLEGWLNFVRAVSRKKKSLMHYKLQNLLNSWKKF